MVGMNKEEKEAIRRVTETRNNIMLTAFPAGNKDMTFFAMDLHTILELVDKQQKEIEKLENKIDNLVEEQIERQKYLTTLEEKCEKQQKEIKKLNIENQALYESQNIGDNDLLVRTLKEKDEEIEELKSFINLGNLEEMYILLNAKTEQCEDIRNERDRALKVIDKMADKMKQHLPFTLEIPYGASKEELIDYFYKEIE